MSNKSFSNEELDKEIRLAELNDLIDTLNEDQAALKTALKTLIDRFDYENIIALLGLRV